MYVPLFDALALSSHLKKEPQCWVIKVPLYHIYKSKEQKNDTGNVVEGIGILAMHSLSVWLILPTSIGLLYCIDMGLKNG